MLPIKIGHFSLKSRHFSNVVAVGFSASSSEYRLDGINASKKLVSLIKKNAFCHRSDYICRNRANTILFVLILFLHCFVIAGGNVRLYPMFHTVL